MTFFSCICSISHELCTRFAITVASYWARWRLKSLAARLCAWPFVHAHIKENINATRHWTLSAESTDHHTKCPYRRKCFLLMASSWCFTVFCCVYIRLDRVHISSTWWLCEQGLSRAQKHYICNVFCHWHSSCAAIYRNRALITALLRTPLTKFSPHQAKL